MSDEINKCFLCSKPTDFLAHAEDVCLSCGDNAQDSKWALEVMRRYHAVCQKNADAVIEIVAEKDKRISELSAEAESWEATARLQSESKLPCGHPNDFGVDMSSDGTWSKIGCVGCQLAKRDVEVKGLKADQLGRLDPKRVNVEFDKQKARIKELEEAIGAAIAFYLSPGIGDDGGEMCKILEKVRP